MEPRVVELDEHLFRHEAGRIVAALTRIFGVHNLALAEDVVQDAFCRALEVWKFRGVPANPSAWLMATARNRAIDVLRRERTARTFAPELSRFLESEWTLVPVVHELFGAQAIQDDELRMMFSCCHPRLAEPAQVALILHILCGFNVDEVAGAFLSSRSAIEKRITRAKKVLAGSKKLFELTADDFSARLSAVHRALYLLFNEGYHGASSESAVRVELCTEAIRLTGLLLRHPLASTPATLALGALMLLHAARLPGRVDASGDLHSLFEQDRSSWDKQLLAEGQRLLDLSATGTELTEYHVEAAIASVHAEARSAEETDWQRIVSLYDTLLAIRPSPVVALNRAIAVAQQSGPERGLEEIRAISSLDRLASYPFYPATLGELELRSGRPQIAHEHFCAALALTRSSMEHRFVERRIAACSNPAPENSPAGTPDPSRYNGHGKDAIT
ncbi:MAG TPA: sigma-70 family RNA polymerase sigma factor [Silvibacterium sp.]|jgi:RNA polymerase sigma-70 factor (ECF subfamily)|nr:sigma-70 family RNA polymerase sigma factor [Silvibacterium sp.]